MPSPEQTTSPDAPLRVPSHEYRHGMVSLVIETARRETSSLHEAAADLLGSWFHKIESGEVSVERGERIAVRRAVLRLASRSAGCLHACAAVFAAHPEANRSELLPVLREACLRSDSPGREGAIAACADVLRNNPRDEELLGLLRAVCTEPSGEPAAVDLAAKRLGEIYSLNSDQVELERALLAIARVPYTSSLGYRAADIATAALGASFVSRTGREESLRRNLKELATLPDTPESLLRHPHAEAKCAALTALVNRVIACPEQESDLCTFLAQMPERERFYPVLQHTITELIRLNQQLPAPLDAIRAATDVTIDALYQEGTIPSARVADTLAALRDGRS